MENMSIHDWTSQTDDPVNDEVRNNIIDYLNRIRVPIPSNNYDLYLKLEVTGKDVLDIGICAHTMERMRSPNWIHNIIRNNAKSAMGIDIIKDLIQQLQKDGLDVAVCDATSDEDLGRQFDVVHVGDVLEHVDNPVALMKFCGRHLRPGGKIIARTPNAHCFNYIHLQRKYGTEKSNLEHMFYICPIHAMELARRSKMRLTRYLTLYPGKLSIRGIARFLKYTLSFKFRHALAEFLTKPESYSTILVFEFKKTGLVHRFGHS